MAGFTYDNLVTDIRNYTETDSNVLTAAIVNRIIEDAEFKILRDVPLDAYKKQKLGNLVTGQSTINVPAKTLFVKGIQVYDSTSAATGSNSYLEKKDETYLQEYIPAETSTGKPKYYAMFGGGTGESDTTSGRIAFSPVPNTTYRFRVHFNKMPDLLESDGTNYISMNFPNGLLYCCLSEAYAFLKGPIDMLTLYENKYKQEVQKFANEQVGRRRRDDYTDGTVRIPVNSANP